MEFDNENLKGKNTLQKVQKMLNDEGINVTLEKAAGIFSFLKFLANGVVKKFLNEKRKFLITKVILHLENDVSFHLYLNLPRTYLCKYLLLNGGQS